MLELELTKESPTPNPFSFSGNQPCSCYLPILCSSVKKNKPSDWRNDKVWAVARSVSEFAAVSWPSAVHTHTHNIPSAQTWQESVCEWPHSGNGKNVERRCHNSGSSTGLSNHTYKPNILHFIHVHPTQICTFDTHPVSLVHIDSYAANARPLTEKCIRVQQGCHYEKFNIAGNTYKAMQYSPTGDAKWLWADRRAQLPAVPKSHFTSSHLQVNTGDHREDYLD